MPFINKSESSSDLTIFILPPIYFVEIINIVVSKWRTAASPKDIKTLIPYSVSTTLFNGKETCLRGLPSDPTTWLYYFR